MIEVSFSILWGDWSKSDIQRYPITHFSLSVPGKQEPRIISTEIFVEPASEQFHVERVSDRL